MSDKNHFMSSNFKVQMTYCLYKYPQITKKISNMERKLYVTVSEQFKVLLNTNWSFWRQVVYCTGTDNQTHNDQDKTDKKHTETNLQTNWLSFKKHTKIDREKPKSVEQVACKYCTRLATTVVHNTALNSFDNLASNSLIITVQVLSVGDIWKMLCVCRKVQARVTITWLVLDNRLHCAPSKERMRSSDASLTIKTNLFSK